MIARRPSAILLSSTSSYLQCLPPCKSELSASFRHPRPIASPASTQRRQASTTSADDLPPDALHWPDPIPPHQVPTPYQILDCPSNAPYTDKSRFYQLVKLYHPDRHQINTQQSAQAAAALAALPPHILTDRYRLIVAAHTILSNPAKRSAYDAHGDGWAAPHRHRFTPPSQHHRAHEPGSPMHNATWEDWERWRWEQAHPEGGQAPVYFSNSRFVLLVAAFAVLGGLGQIKWATGSGERLLEKREDLHLQASRELREARKASIQALAQGGKEERIQSFLLHRAGSGPQV